MPVDTRPFFFRPAPGGDSCRPQYGAAPEALEESIRLPPACIFRDECADCHAGTFTREEQTQPQTSYRYRLSVDEATETTQTFLDEISQHKDHISHLLSTHADDIISRWGKKGRFGSQQKREDLLKAVAPDLPESSDFIVAWRYNKNLERLDLSSRLQGTQNKLMLPWLSVDLLKTHPDALFALLHYRTTYEPAKWAAFDRLQFEKRFQQGNLDADWCPKAMIMHGKQKYGCLVDWDVHGIHRADLIGFPLGLLILKSQAYLMKTIRRVVDAIMEGTSLFTSSRTEKWQRLTQADDFKPTGSVEPWSSYTHGFLRPAPKLSGLDIVSLARSRRERSEDQLRALQCNMPYMRRLVQSIFAPTVWQRVAMSEKASFLGSQIHGVLNGYVLWRSLESEVEHFDAVRLKYRDMIAPGEPLPPGYDRALGHLELLLINHITLRSSALLYQIAVTPAFMMHPTFAKAPGEASEGPIRNVLLTNHNDTMEVYKTDRLYWILAQFSNHPENTDSFDYPVLFALLHEHLAGSPRKERERLDELLYEQTNDLATCHELLTVVGRLGRPQSTNPVIEQAIKTERFAWRVLKGYPGAVYYSKFPAELSLLHSVWPIAGSSLMDAFKMHQPPQGPRGTAWVQYNKESNSALDQFWDIMQLANKLWLSHMTLKPEEEAVFNGVLSFGTSTEHVEALRAEESAILTEVQKRQNKFATLMPVFVDSRPTSPPPLTTRTRHKNKTRPEKAKPSNTDAEDDADGLHAFLPKLSLSHATDDNDDDEPPLKLIPVSRRNFDEVFGAIFPADRAEAKRAVDWNTFSRAMQAVGCELDNGSGGSEVMFRHQVFGKITFHKPHPEPKIDPVKLHAWGDRLARRFAWSRDRFVVIAVGLSEGADVRQRVG